MLIALAYVPIVAFVGLLIITIFRVIDDGISKLQADGNWWVILIVVYFLSLILLVYAQHSGFVRARQELIDGYIYYYKEKNNKQNITIPTNQEIEEIKNILMKKIKIWAWFNKDLWNSGSYNSYIIEMAEKYTTKKQANK